LRRASRSPAGENLIFWFRPGPQYCNFVFGIFISSELQDCRPGPIDAGPSQPSDAAFLQGRPSAYIILSQVTILRW